jgi:hypothetical protein
MRLESYEAIRLKAGKLESWKSRKLEARSSAPSDYYY